MIALCCEELQTHPSEHLWTSRSDPASGQKWIGKMWERNRKAVQDLRDNSVLCKEEFAILFSNLPKVIDEKYGPKQPGESVTDLAIRLLHLVGKHKGEVVEVSERQGRWHLTKGRCPPLDHQQFRVSPKQETKAASPWQRQEPRLFPEQMEDMVRQCRSASQWEVGGTGLEEQMFWPLWSEQQHRFYVPCTGVKEFHWERRCKCTTLGMLFRALGRAFTA